MTARRTTTGARRVFLDSAAYLALTNPHDAHHGEARACWTELTEGRARTFTTNFVIAETHALFLARLGHSHATAFLRQLGRTTTTLIRVREDDEERARAIIFQYEDKDFSLTDATSFAVMERLGLTDAFTFDRHFAQYGFTPLTPNEA